MFKTLVFALVVLSVNAQASGRGYLLDQLAAQKPTAHTSGRSGGSTVASRPTSHYRNDGLKAYVAAVDGALASSGVALPKLSVEAKGELYLSSVGAEPKVDAATIESIMSGLSVSHAQAASIAADAQTALSAN
jgi:hypothetical protein